MYSLILWCLMRRLRLRWRGLYPISTSEGDFTWRTSMLKNTSAFFEEDRVLAWSANIFWAIGADEAALGLSDLSIVSLQGDDIQDSDTRCDQSLLSASEISMENVLESSCKLRIREQEKERHRAMPSYQRLMTARRYLNQMIRTRSFTAKNERKERERVLDLKSNREECQQWEKNGSMRSGESKWTVFKRRLLQFQSRKCSWTTNTTVLSCSEGADTDWRKKAFESLRKSLGLGKEVLLERKVGQRACQNYFKGSCANPSCDCWHPPVCQNYKSVSGCNHVENADSDTLRLTSSPVKSRRESVGKDQLLNQTSPYYMFVYLKILIREHLLYGRAGHWDQIAPSHSTNAHYAA